MIFETELHQLVLLTEHHLILPSGNSEKIVAKTTIAFAKRFVTTVISVPPTASKLKGGHLADLNVLQNQIYNHCQEQGELTLAAMMPHEDHNQLDLFLEADSANYNHRMMVQMNENLQNVRIEAQA